VISIANTRKRNKKVNSKITAASAGLTDIELKLLRLALDKGAYEGEADNAVVMFVRKLRERNIKADDLFGQTPAISKCGNEKMTFGKYRDEMIRNVPVDYLIWAVNNCANMSTKLKQAIRKFLTESEF